MAKKLEAKCFFFYDPQPQSSAFLLRVTGVAGCSGVQL